MENAKTEGEPSQAVTSLLSVPARTSGEGAPSGLLLLVLGLLRRRRRLVLRPVVLARVGEGSVVGAGVSACAGGTKGVSAFSTVPPTGLTVVPSQAPLGQHRVRVGL